MAVWSVYIWKCYFELISKGHDFEWRSSLKDHKGSVYSVNFFPDGNYIVSGSSDKTVKIWQKNTRNLIKKKNYFSIIKTP